MQKYMFELKYAIANIIFLRFFAKQPIIFDFKHQKYTFYTFQSDLLRQIASNTINSPLKK